MKVVVKRTGCTSDPHSRCGFHGCGTELEQDKDYLILVGDWWWGACRAHIKDFLKGFQHEDAEEWSGTWVSREEEG